MSDFTLEPLYDYPQREQVLALARTNAEAVDRGERSPFETLREIAKDGLITLGRDGGCDRQWHHRHGGSVQGGIGSGADQGEGHPR